MREAQHFFGPLLDRTVEDPRVGLIFLREMWPVLVGKDLAAKCAPHAIRAKTLRVGVADISWRREIASLEGTILGRIHGFWGRRWIERIEFFVHPSLTAS